MYVFLVAGLWYGLTCMLFQWLGCGILSQLVLVDVMGQIVSVDGVDVSLWCQAKKEDETGRGTHGSVLIVDVVAGTVKLARYFVSVVLVKTWLDLWHGMCNCFVIVMLADAIRWGSS